MAKVLLIAPTCDGTDVGEAWVAFQWASRLAEVHDLTVLTYHKRDKTPAAAQLPGVRVIEWAEPPLVGRAERLNSMLKPGYVPFYWKARQWIKAALARGEHFDVVHQPVPVAMRYPCPAQGLDIPFIIGPVGGALDSPPGFKPDEGTTPWFVKLRNIDHFRLQHDPLLRRTYEGAACVMGIAPYVSTALAGLDLKRFEVMSETAVDVAPEPVVRVDHAPELRLLFVGRLIRTKGVRDAVQALSLIDDQNVTLDVVGDGPDREACEALAARLGLAPRIRFHGMQPKQSVFDFYRRADVFVFPSYREPGGNVVFEAMAFGLPLVVCDRGGPGAAVDSSCAISIPVSTPDQLARDTASAILALQADPVRRRAMGEAARLRLENTALWPAKVARMSTIYDEIAR